MTNCEPSAPEWKLERIPINELVYDPNLLHDYLHQLSHRPIVKDDYLHIPPVVVYRHEGINYIVDGQHTIDIVVRMTGSKDTDVWCRVYDNIKEASVLAGDSPFLTAV